MSVISYDRLVTTPGQLLHLFDNVRSDSFRAKRWPPLKQDGKATGPIVMINGAPTTKRQAVQARRDGALNRRASLASADTPGLPDKAQNEMQQAITASATTGSTGSASSTAGGAIAAMKSAGVNYHAADHRAGRGARRDPADPRRHAVHDRLQGIKPEAEGAATMAVDLVNGRKPAPTVKDKVDNGQLKVPSVLLKPACDQDNINDTVVKDGF
jgi:D-xylose transport system substrate-binding protein